MLRRVGWLLLIVLALAPATVWGADAATPADLLERARDAYRRGAFEEAVADYTEAARVYQRQGEQGRYVVALIHLSEAYSALGLHQDAVRHLTGALQIAEGSARPELLAPVLAALGSAYLATGPVETARTYLERSLVLAREQVNASLSASVLNSLGNLHAGHRRHDEALVAYEESVALARSAGDRLLAARALTNAAITSRQRDAAEASRDLLDRAIDQLQGVVDSHDRAFTLVTIGVVYRDLQAALPLAADRLRQQSSEALREAGRIAGGLGDRRTASYAWGYLGSLYEQERRYPEALQVTRRAVFAAQQANAPESLYRWEWQVARLLKKSGAVDDAIAAYRRAVATLQSIRPEFSGGALALSFRESVGAVYFELVDLLLGRASSLADLTQSGLLLTEAREAVELFKAAELRDYFRDDCVDAVLSTVTPLDVVSRTAVVVYPILLPDRIEILVTLSSGLKRYAVPVGGDTVTREVRQLRRLLEKRTTREYLPHAQQLYRWLIAPLDADLASQRVDALIFVPDGPLRTIPMAALHDGERFLIEKYPLGITPGLNLTDPRPLRRERLKVLAVGVTEAVQGFPPLPAVSAELEAVRGVFENTTTLVDREFLVANLADKLKDEEFTVVHIASHGQFGGDVETTFVLAFDDKLSMDRLDQMVGTFRFREAPLELLTLSACDTAAGDDRAALGLAGVAIKAGARSALATLWHINDPVSAELVAAFYRELKSPETSRAVALQRAQIKTLADPRYEHPGFWSPFLLINNWL